MLLEVKSDSDKTDRRSPYTAYYVFLISLCFAVGFFIDFSSLSLGEVKLVAL